MTYRKERWTSRLGYISAALGMCIGTGNVWHFPRRMAANGGGAFIVCWTVAMLVYAVPLLASEMAIGKRTRLGPIGAFRDFVGHRATWRGFFVCAVCMLLMSYYSVVMGYCVKYFTLSFTPVFSPGLTTAGSTDVWNSFTGSSWQVVLFNFISVLLGFLVVRRGVSRGIERACRLLIPALFVILVLIAVYACCLPGASAGLEYMFHIDARYFARLDTWLSAFVQAAWSTGAGWGFIIVYSGYCRDDEDVPNSSMAIGVGDNLGALLAGLAVVPTLFALSPGIAQATEAARGGAYNLTFVYLFQLFTTMNGGRAVSVLFFLLLAGAALTSLFSMIEAGVRTLMDMGLTRKKAALWVCGAGFVIGGFSAWSLGNLNNQDWVWSLGLLVSGLFISLAVLKRGVESVRVEDVNAAGALWLMPKWYYNGCMRLIPAIVVVLLAWRFAKAVGGRPDSWWNPFQTESVGTVVLQWAVVFALGLSLNGFLNRKTARGPMTKKGRHIK